MDRRSWLWRRKSSERSPGAAAAGETESSGSLSSHSERFSDDQAYSNHNSQSPEVTSKDAPLDEGLDDNVKNLKDKLSAALLNISAKEDLVKQHAKVAEEAVSGWEKAENEVLALKQQVDHLDGALKECLRQLRQAREEKEQKMREAIDKKVSEWQSTKSELENQLAELQSQLQAAKAEASISNDTELCPRLETAEKQNSALKLELCSIAEDLELRTIERDLSAQAAETASKQHLESKKKMAKLEAECRRLKLAARKALTTNDRRSVTASSAYVESITDSQSDSGEGLLGVESDTHKMSSAMVTHGCEPSRSESWASALVGELDQFKHDKAFGRNLMAPAVEINLMDDFLEMERLAALPESGSGSSTFLRALADQSGDRETHLKAELEAAINRRSELEDMLEKMEIEKVELEINLTKHQAELTTSRNRLKDAESKLKKLETLLSDANEARKGAETELESTRAMLETLKDRLEKTEMNLGKVQTQLNMVSDARRLAEAELEATHVKKERAESQYIVVEAELKTFLSKVGSLEEEVQKERALSGEMNAKCQKLEDEILRMQYESEHRKAAILNGELKIKQEMELTLAESKFAECQKTIASLGRQLKSLATLDDFLIDPENHLEVSEYGT